MERATLGSSGDGGDRTGSNCDGCGWVLSSGEEGRKVGVMFFFSESMGHEKVCAKCCLPHNTQRCSTSAES